MQRGGSERLTMRLPTAVRQRNLARRTGSHPSPPSSLQWENSRDEDGANRTHQLCRCWSYSLRSAVVQNVRLICDAHWRSFAAITREPKRAKQFIVQTSRNSHK